MGRYDGSSDEAVSPRRGSRSGHRTRSRSPHRRRRSRSRRRARDSVTTAASSSSTTHRSHRSHRSASAAAAAAAPAYKVLCVSSIHHKVSEDIIRDELYRQYRKFVDVSIKVVFEHDGERVAYVYFRSAEDARDAKHMSKGRLLFYDKPALIEPVYETAPLDYSLSPRGGRHSRSPPLPPLPPASMLDYPHIDMRHYLHHRSPPLAPPMAPPPPHEFDARYGPPPSHHPLPPHHHHLHEPYGYDLPPGLPEPYGAIGRAGGFGYREPPRGPPFGPYGGPQYGPPYGGGGGGGGGSSGGGGGGRPRFDRHDRKDRFPNYLHHVAPEDDPTACRTLFAGNMELNITEEEIRRIFGRYGSVEDVDIKRPPPGTGNAFAFVRFDNLQQSYKCKLELSGQYIGKFQVKIGYGKPLPSCKVWVGNLSTGGGVSLALLEREFDRFGAIKQIDYVRGAAHAHVLYETLDAAQAAVSEMRGASLTGSDKRLRTDFAPDETAVQFGRRGNGGGGENGRANSGGSGGGGGGSRRSNNHSRSNNDGRHSPERPSQTASSSTATLSSSSSSTAAAAAAAAVPSAAGSGCDSDASPGRRPDAVSDNNTSVNSIAAAAASTPVAPAAAAAATGAAADAAGSAAADETDGTGESLSDAGCLGDIARAAGVAWSGCLVLKSSMFACRLHLVSGSRLLAAALLRDAAGRPHLLRITQRLRLDQPKLDDVHKRIASSTHAVYVALPCAATAGGATGGAATSSPPPAGVQSRSLRNLVSYLRQKEAAGVTSLLVDSTSTTTAAAAGDTDDQQLQQTAPAAASTAAGVLYAFPPCAFSRQLLVASAPALSEAATSEDHLLVVVMRGASV